MKRISLLTIVILTAVPGVTKADIYNYHYGSVRYRTRWSPYAFSHKRSGLISGYVRYSPYAFNHKHSGLVPRNIRYSPYAFSHKHSGLIDENAGYSPYAFSNKHTGLVIGTDYGVFYRTCPAPVVVVHSVRPSCAQSYKHSEPSDVTNNSNREKLIARREKIKKLKESKRQINLAKGKDGKELICRYLKSKNIDNYKTHGLLRINGKTINVNFLLKDRNIMITYWDLDEVQSLVRQPGYQRNYLEKHEKEWRNFYEKFTQAGGKVYQITSANEKEILAKLVLCSELNDG